MRVHHLNCGTMCPVVFGLAQRLPRQRMICHVLLIETPQSGLVLVDTGFGTMDLRKPALLGAGFAKIARPKLREEETALSHIERLGFKREDVRHIVPTHLDLDHAGGLPDFPNAMVHAFAPEVDAMEAGATLAERNRYRKHQFAHGPKWQRYQVQGERFFGLESVRELKGLPPELLLVPTVGHSRGHVAVVVEGGSEVLVHAGDAYFNHAEIFGSERDCPWQLRAFQRLAATDNRARLHNQARLRELARQPSVRLFCAHDAAEAWELGVR